MILQLSIGSVFLAGLLSFLSPCVLPLVLPYLCYLSGVNIDELKKTDSSSNRFMRLRVVFFACFFVLGFTTIFVLLGASASSLGHLFALYRPWFTFLAGILIIIMGLNFLGLLQLRFLLKEVRFHSKAAPLTPIGAYLMGAAFAFGWTPCIGPVLASILAIAGTKDTAFEGAKMLAVYAFGLGVPFLAAAFFSSFFIDFLQKFRVHLGKVEKIIGLFLILIGLLFLTNHISNISYWFM